jgi:asparagine N-glycosylation enzyme membrane subunit Stt3
MYLEPEVLPLLLICFGLVMLCYSVVLFRIARKTDADTKFPCIAQIVTTVIAFILFVSSIFPELFGISIDDHIHGGVGSGTIAFCGVFWALSMFFNAGILWNLHKKKK